MQHYLTKFTQRCPTLQSTNNRALISEAYRKDKCIDV